MTRSEYRPRTGAELIDTAFQLIKTHFATLMSIAMLACIPALLGVLMTLALGVRHGGWVVLNNVLAVVTVLLLQGSLLSALSDAYLGHSVYVGQALSTGATNMGRLLVAHIAMMLCIALGFVLLIVPGFIVIAWLFVVPALVVIEHAPLSSVLSRSRALCRDVKLRILGFLMVVFVTAIIFGAVVGVGGALTRSATLIGVLLVFVYVAIFTLSMALMTVQYYDSRIRKEGYDVELMAETLTPAGQPQPATA